MVVKKNCIDCGKNCTGQRCRKCHIKFSGKSFNFGIWNFDTQTSLDLAIKTNLKYMPYNVEIKDDFLLAIINNLHKEVIKRNLKCTKIKILDYQNQIREWEFCRKRFRGGIFVTGYFEPINKWHGVTLYPHKKKSVKAKLIMVLRQKWSEQAEEREPNAKCEKGGESNPMLHHDNIPFKDIANECLDYFSEEEKEKGIGDDWWWHESEADAIPDNHPAIQHMLKLHEKVIYKWLCRKCHGEEHQ